MADPNPDDPLMPDIAQKFKRNREAHDKAAREWTGELRPGWLHGEV